MVVVGDRAPDFTLLDQNGLAHTLSAYRGRWVLVYFYPKDDTPGCTVEACTLEEQFPKFEKLKAQVFGISADPVASHKKFADKYHLTFPLLADVDKKAIEAYGVWQKKHMMGRAYMGIVRNSYLIDPTGIIKKVYEKVKPAEHAEEVLTDLTSFGA